MADNPYKPTNNGSQVVQGKPITAPKKGKVHTGSDLRTGGKK